MGLEYNRSRLKYFGGISNMQSKFRMISFGIKSLRKKTLIILFFSLYLSSSTRAHQPNLNYVLYSQLHDTRAPALLKSLKTKKKSQDQHNNMLQVQCFIPLLSNWIQMNQEFDKCHLYDFGAPQQNFEAVENNLVLLPIMNDKQKRVFSIPEM
jgi:hypothetical protein